MKIAKDFNNISEELKRKIPQLKPGQVVTFQMLNGKPNQDPTESARQAQPLVFGKTQLQTKFRIYDPAIKNASGEVVGGNVDIILAEDWVGDIPTKATCFVAGKDDSIFLGKFELRGDTAVAVIRNQQRKDGRTFFC